MRERGRERGVAVSLPRSLRPKQSLLHIYSIAKEVELEPLLQFLRKEGLHAFIYVPTNAAGPSC